MIEILTITYDGDPSKIGGQVEYASNAEFLYGNGWQEGNFWRSQNHLDRLTVECLIDKDAHPMSVVQSEDDRYNVLLHRPLVPDRYQSPLSRLYLGIIARPEHAALILAQLGNVDRLLEMARTRRGILTDEDMHHLETWSRIQLIADGRSYLERVQPTYRNGHKDQIIKWQKEMGINQVWLEEYEISPTYDPGETLYKDILNRVIDNILSKDPTLTEAVVTLV